MMPRFVDKRYYSKQKRGQACGTEPLRYVQRIREYEHILANELSR